MENASDDFPQQKKLENLLPNFAGSSPPISPKTSPTSLWKSLVLRLSAENVHLASAASNPKDPAVLKTLRVVNHYRDGNSLPR